MLKFIHLTDIHLISGGRRLYGVSPERRLHAAIDSINQEHSDADFVVLTGDQVHWGDDDNYRVLADAIARLDIPVKPMMGNHDNRKAMLTALPSIETDENGFIQYALDTEAGRCLFLDTKIEAETDAGEYCPKRLAWLKQQLESTDAPVIIFMHHPPMKLGLKGMDIIALLDAEPFYAVLKPHISRIRQIFFGHVHRPICGNWRGMAFSCIRGLNHQLALDLEAPETSVPGNFEPPTYGVALADAEQIIIHMHEFMDRSPHFELVTPEGMDGREYSLHMRHGDWDRMT
ncbi:phosphodiesterase [Hoeflea sp. TYP-13]|uniref:phosphodiesterase n=1 Tax=Hoeflea sp. TYP-13 TaxID=3230023 RepID=UPI0034C61D98